MVLLRKIISSNFGGRYISGLHNLSASLWLVGYINLAVLFPSHWSHTIWLASIVQISLTRIFPEVLKACYLTSCFFPTF